MRQRLFVAGVIGGVAAVVVLAVVVLQFGRFDPSPPSLRDEPNAAIPGQVAYLNDKGCVIRATASGTEHEQVYCLGEQYRYGPGLLTWLDATTIGLLEMTDAGKPVSVPGGPQYELVRLDTKTKTLERTGQKFPPQTLQPFGTAVSPSGETADIQPDGDVYLIKDGIRTQVASFEVPEYGGPRVATWSPDGKWLLLAYYPRDSDGKTELWVLSRDGQTKGTLATDAGGGPGVAWWIDGVGSSPALDLSTGSQ